jgi:phenylalanyl-tRNA synthetase alpha chain
MPNYLSPNEPLDALSIRDLSDPRSGAHALQVLLQSVTNALCSRWEVPERIVRHSPNSIERTG